MPTGSRGPPEGALAAASLLAVALGNPSLAGSAFLLLFLIWALVVLPSTISSRSQVSSRALWGTAAALSTAAAALQAGVQLAFAARTPGIRRHEVAKTLEVLGFSRIASWRDAALEAAPLVLAAVATARQAALSAGSRARHDRRRGTEAFHGPGNAAVLAAMGLLGAAAARPALLSLPYAISIAAALYKWSRGACTSSSAALRGLQAYAGAHLVALYVFQWALSYAAPLRPLADLLGLFTLDYSAAWEPDFARGVAAVVSLAVLVPALGAVRHERGSDDNDGLGAPLLSEEQQPTNLRIPTQRQRTLGGWVASLLPSFAAVALKAWCSVFSHSGAVAVAVAAAALLRPSVLGGALVAGAAAALAAPQPGGAAPRWAALSGFWAAILWLLGSYVATAVAPSLGASAVAEALGAHAFSSGGALLALMAVLAAVAAHLRCLNPSGTATAAQSWPPQRLRLLQALDVAASGALPAAIFAAGAASYDAIHGALLAGLAVALAALTLRLRPTLSAAAPSQAAVLLLRIYVAAALVAIYTVWVGSLDAFGAALQPPGARGVLRALGLWAVSASDAAPLLALLAVAAAQSAVSQATAPPPSAPPPPSVSGVPTWRPAWLLAISRTGASWGAAAFAAGIYVLVLTDSAAAGLGAAYLAVTVAALAAPPKRGRWVADSDSTLLEALSDSRSYPGVALVDSPAWRWVPLAVAALTASAHFAAQAILPAVAGSGWPVSISDDAAEFLRKAVGVEVDASGDALALCLLRPALVLAALALYRRMYCLGTLVRQLDHTAAGEEELRRRQLAAQWGVAAAARRAAILHAPKTVSLLAFATAMQVPSALGWALVVGAVMAAPLRGHLRAALLAAQALASAWLLAQYVVQIPWLNAALPEPTAAALAWLGLDSAPAGPGRLEGLLRLKAALLAAVALNRCALIWLKRLPEEVKAEARCGAPCPLFWPPRPDYPRPGSAEEEEMSEENEEDAQLRHQEQQEQRLAAALRGAAHRAGALMTQALQAVDWPSPRAQDALEPDFKEGIVENEPSESSPLPPHPAPRSAQLAALRFALQDWAERCYDDWGLEFSLFALLLAAFIAANALSLAAMVAVAAGMAAAPEPRRMLWRWAVLPALSVAAVWQYAALMGWAPFDLRPSGWGSAGLGKKERDGGLAPEVRVWLGLEDVAPATVWAMFLAFGATALQVQVDLAASCAAVDAEARDSLAAPLLGHPASQTRRATSSPDLWAPLTPEARSSWRWHDWVRYRLYTRSLDVLLVLVVALCTADNDAIHAGYLALALFFFRSRVALRVRRGALFAPLPIFNFVAMTVVLAYQAPFETAWDDSKTCSLAHLLGLYKLHSGAGPSSLLSWGYEGAVADLVLWVAIRVQTHLFASPDYAAAVEVAEAEEGAERAARKAEVAEWKQGQADAAVDESVQRAARQLRISRIKAGVESSLSRFGTGVAPTVLDYAFLDAAASRGGEGAGKRDGGRGDGDSRPQRGELRQRRGRRDTAHEGSGEDVAPQPLPEHGASAALLTEYERELARASEAELAKAEREGTAGATAVDATAPGPSSPPSFTRHPLHNHLSISVWGGLWEGLGLGAAARWAAAVLPRRADRRESALAYALFVFAYLSDLSLLTLVLPLSAFLYALVDVRPSRTYWRAVLVYCEALIVASYALQVPARLACGFITPEMEAWAEALGVHTSPARCVPLFFVYLATLRHTHGLLTHYAAGQRAAAAAAEAEAAEVKKGSSRHGQLLGHQEADLEAAAGSSGPGSCEQGVEEAAEEAELGYSRAEDSSSPVAVAIPPLPLLARAAQAVATAASGVCEFFLTACTACERPPGFVLVEVRGAGAGGDGVALETALQGVIDGLRAQGLRRERVRRDQSAASVSEETWEGAAAAATTGATSTAAVASNDNPGKLAGMGPLKLRFHSFLGASAAMNAAAELPAASSTAAEPTVRALLEVIALPSTPTNTPGACTVPGWPLRSLHPAAAAASALVAAPPSSPLEILSAEPHARQARDFYAATALCDAAVFLFVAVYYNRVVHAAGSLAEVTSEGVVPLGYLLTLLTLFMFFVADRVVYTLGSPGGKAALHVTSMALYFWYCSVLVWGRPEAAAAPPRDLLRVILALKSASFALSALQLRSGYPPPASYANGMGRHSFVFMRSVSTPAAAAFHVFAAVPFLYEMRQVLDWACTPTTLTLYDWLKLEDINVSLYFAAAMRASRAWRAPGTRQPRYLKFFQGTLLFAALILLLWVPLLVFSTGNPTYQVPTLAAFGVNVTLQASVPASSLEDVPFRASLPLFRGGQRGAWVPWAPGGALPEALAADYAPEQLQLLCAPGDSDSVWSVSPPARAALEAALDAPDSAIAVSLGWEVLRDLPPPSDHGGPGCAGMVAAEVAAESKRALLRVLRGDLKSAPLLRSIGPEPGNSTAALFPAFWLLRGEACAARPLQGEDLRGATGLPSRRRSPPDLAWTDRWLACNASLRTAAEESFHSQWWRLECSIVDRNGTEVPDSSGNDDPAPAWPLKCPTSPASLFAGPRAVAVLDRVQGGIIGATLTKFGVLGLYSVFVYGIGRALRLATTNLRARIQFEDLPTARRLVALCQDIYIARAEGLLALEEELYGALLAVYRLPQVMYELTKAPPKRD